MQIEIDHATICGSELEPMREALAKVGLVSDYGGPHANGVTHMAPLGFEDGSYLELIAPLRPGRVEGSPWGNLMLGDAGAGAWAVRTTNIEAEVARLRSLGIETAGPEAGSRKRPDGKLLEWQTASAGHGAPGARLPFLIQDRTPREWRVQPSPSGMRSGLTGIMAVVLGVKDVDAAAARFRRAYSWDAPRLEEHADFGAKLAHFPGTPVMLAEPVVTHSWLASRLGKFGEIPAAFLLKTEHIRQAARSFHLIGETKWFGHFVAWFEPGQLSGIRLGVVEH
jgi:Glyoxalase-like domain